MVFCLKNGIKYTWLPGVIFKPLITVEIPGTVFILAPVSLHINWYVQFMPPMKMPSDFPELELSILSYSYVVFEHIQVISNPSPMMTLLWFFTAMFLLTDFIISPIT